MDIVEQLRQFSRVKTTTLFTKQTIEWGLIEDAIAEIEKLRALINELHETADQYENDVATTALGWAEAEARLEHVKTQRQSAWDASRRLCRAVWEIQHRSPYSDRTLITMAYWLNRQINAAEAFENKPEVAPAPNPVKAGTHTREHRLSSAGEHPAAPQGRAETDGKAGGDPFFITIQSDDGYTRIPVKPGEEEKAITSFIKMLEDVEGDEERDD